MPSSTSTTPRRHRSSSMLTRLTRRRRRRSAPIIAHPPRTVPPSTPVWFDTVSPTDAPRSAPARVARARKIAERLLDPTVTMATALAAAAGGDVRTGPESVGVRSVEFVRLDELISAAVTRVTAVTLRYGDRSVQQSDVADRWARIIGARVRVIVGGAS